MSPSKFIRENFVLMVGLILPALLMLIFLAFAALPPLMHAVPPPKYGFLLSMPDYAHTIPAETHLTVENGQLTVSYIKPNAAQGNSIAGLKLFMYDVGKNAFSPMELTQPDFSRGDDLSKKLVVASTSKLKLDSHQTSPDGYNFLNLYEGGHGGFINEIFMGSSYQARLSLKKGDYSFDLPPLNEAYGNSTFIAWVVTP